jgi:hypothetical protein
VADNREALMFKKVPDGYVFRAPNQWVFGRTRHYLVTEAQKAQLLAIVTTRSQAVFWGVFVGLIGASTAALAYGSGPGHPTARDFVVMLARGPLWVYAALLISIRPTALRLQPLLDGLYLLPIFLPPGFHRRARLQRGQCLAEKLASGGVDPGPTG